MPAVSQDAPALGRRRESRAARGPAGAVTARVFRSGRVLTVVFAYLFAIYSFIQPVGYRRTYPALAGRLAFARDFGGNTGLRLFYGEPRDLLTDTGYSAWRVGGTLAIAAAAFGMLAAVQALRAEEDAGRTELVLAGIISRRAAYWSAMAAIGAATLVLWAAEFAGFALGRLPVAGSAYLALATASVVPVFAGLGAVASQIAPARRMALELGGVTAGLFLLLRAVADIASGAGWLRWATPLGWAEELRPFTGARPAVLLLPVAASVVLLWVAARLGASRDIGSGLLPAHDTAEPRLALLGSPTAQALRSQRDSLIAWAGSFAVFAFVFGVVAGSVSPADVPQSAERQLAKLGSGSIATPAGYLSFIFFFVMLAISLFGCAQIGAARREEASQQLETLLALPVGRVSWLGGRLVIAACSAIVISLMSGLLTWVGAASGGVSMSLPRSLEAGANCLPVAALFLGAAALAYAIVPRASAAIAYGLVTVTFLWQAVGSLLGAPRWLAGLTPFAHAGLVPAQPFRAVSAAIMAAIGLAAAAAALGVFRRRDLIGT
jgi:polyether ionophore transport system permease protein